MIEWLSEIDRKIFLILNGINSDWADQIMLFLSGKWEWAPLYLLLLYLVFSKYKWKGLWFVIVIGLTITLSDQITSGFMKPFFERLRPSRDPSLEGLVHLVDGYTGGEYGFASSHASNSFAIATLMFLCLRDKYSRLIWLFLWAFLVSYSRLYLGVHYPLDLLAGAGVGTIIAWLLSKVWLGISRKYSFE